MNNKTACEQLNVQPDAVWDKAGRPMTSSTNPTKTALEIVQSGVLSDEETALLVTAGVEHLQGKRVYHRG